MFRIIVAALILMGLPVMAGPAAAGSVEKIYSAPTEKIAEYISKKPGRKVIFIYATWCPYCQKDLPAMIKLAKDKPGSVYPVSVDESSDALGIYLSRYPVIPFEVLRAKDTESSGIEDYFGVSPRGGVPYKILLDENGKATEAGNFNTGYIEKYITGD